MRALRLVVWAAGAALCGTVLVAGIKGGWVPARDAWIVYGATLVAITLGIVIWELRPESRTGILLTAFPFAGLLSDLRHAFPASAPAVTVGFAVVALGMPLFAHLVLSYPSGRLEPRIERGFVVVVYGFAVAYALPLLLFYSPQTPRHPEVWACLDSCAVPLTHVGWYDVPGILPVFERLAFLLALGFLALVLRKLVRATPRRRSIVLPLVVAALFVGIQFAATIVLVGDPVSSWEDPGWVWVVTSSVLVVPVALAAGLLWGRGARAAVADLVVELERTPPGSVRDALARTLGDPSLELALWMPERASYVDGSGRPLELPPPRSGRAVTVLGRPEAPVAALVHDPMLLERRALLEAAGAAARLALENERLQAELRAQLAELRASRARIVGAGDEERRRLERDLHDGAQQRLIGLGLALQLAQAALGPEANGAADLLADADAELRATLDELRELAHGIHPAVLTEQGLPAALRTLAERSPLPITIVDLPDERLPAPIEAAAYFLVSEALTNTAKYARASRVRVTLSRLGGDVVIDVDDDGIGGADPSRGSGLNGLSDRVRALDGELEVESPPGFGTHLRAVIPCA